MSNWDYGKFKDLAKYLKSNCKGFSKIKAESISDVYIPDWKAHKKFIPIDCVIELSKLNDISIEAIEAEIIKLKYKISANRNAISFNFLYDVPFATIAEIIKAEGHMKRNFTQCSVSSENMEFIGYIKHLIRKIGVPEHNFYEHVRIEANIPHNDVQKVVDSNSKELPFSIRPDKKKISFCETSLKKGEKNTYKIILKDGKIVNLFVEIPQNSKTIKQSSYKNAVQSLL